jgi:outer membrane murein-binding lipoprotein Lpp
MSTRRPHEGPTEPLRPSPPAGVVHERVVAPVIDPGLAYTRLERTVDSLRTWLLVVAVAAIAALAVAIYALVTADDARNNGSAGQQGYATNARVDRLSSDVKALRAAKAGGGDTASLAARVAALEAAAKTPSTSGSAGASALTGRVAALEAEVKTLSSRPATPDATSALQQLSSRVDTLAADVAQLKQSQPPPP